MLPSTPSIFDLTYDELAARVGEPNALEVFQDVYARRRPLSAKVATVLQSSDIGLGGLQLVEQTAGSMTSKFIFAVSDGAAIETVSIKRRTGYTACVSSQVGCAMGCRFCASGRLGLKRHLSSGEIIEQVLGLGLRINRIVFMGIGEPLHNYDQVIRAIRTLRDRRGANFQTSGITISTIGVPKGLRRLREEHIKINLTISLHATLDDDRHRLIPGSKKESVAEVVALSQSWATRHGRPVTYVYLLLPGINDSEADAKRLIHWFRDRPARINLMRWNPVEGGDVYQRIDDRGLSRFRARLVSGGVPAVVRDTQGRDIEAACGQLWLHRELQASRDLSASTVG
ncbi:MAG: 23S rRNA (adenine(2503)-C(2))-methyltransferase RlmN [Solirubrobacteraceae bacterium]